MPIGTWLRVGERLGCLHDSWWVPHVHKVRPEIAESPPVLLQVQNDEENPVVDDGSQDNEEEEEEEDKSAKMGRCCRSWKVENSQRKDTDAARRGPTRYGSPGHLRVDDCHGKEAGEDHIPRKWALLALGMVGWDRSFHGDDEGLMLVAHT